MTRELVERRVADLLEEHPPGSVPDVDFWEAQFDAGLAFVHFPEGNGGLGLAPAFQRVINTKIMAGGGSVSNIARNPIGYGMGAPTVATHGTEEQRLRWLKPLFTAEEIWCQLFSEPGAGSDVAGLATKAVRDGDEWVINGQKVWTTLAHTARWGMLLARTDPDLPKHDGLTYFIADMRQLGVEVRPLRQITGEAEFNEVYFTDARVSDGDRLGAVGDGWRVAITTLMHERVFIGSDVPPKGGGPIKQVVETWRRIDERDPARRDMLMRLWVEAEAARLTTIRAGQLREVGTPGPAGAAGKLHWAELHKRITSFGLDLLGPEGMLYPSTYEMVRPASLQISRRDPQKNFVRARATSIEGGTSEIMRNIIGERVLGLPGEPRGDKDIPWKEVPRS
ncbi:MAG: acyl-CoA dehydrogenase family protein [Acidimicrobiia bacterium]